eukprot:gene4638-biopygen13010
MRSQHRQTLFGNKVCAAVGVLAAHDRQPHRQAAGMQQKVNAGNVLRRGRNGGPHQSPLSLSESGRPTSAAVSARSRR